VIDAWSAADVVSLIDGGVYWQTVGPRFETAAEIRVIASHADVVGMTLAAECVVAGELGLPYAAICVVDNLANGVGEEPLSPEEVAAGAAANRERLIAGLEAVLPDLAKPA
jgi:5'-methylthioadenosine phosphorylase